MLAEIDYLRQIAIKADQFAPPFNNAQTTQAVQYNTTLSYAELVQQTTPTTVYAAMESRALESIKQYIASVTAAQLNSIYIDPSTITTTAIHHANSASVTIQYRTNYAVFDATVPNAETLRAFDRSLYRNLIKSNLLIRINSSRQALDMSVSPAELKARDTLRDMLTEWEWRRYVTNGFIMVKGTLGRYYQIFNRCDERVRVYQGNQHTHSICIHTDTSCPPTDHVINMKVLIELDEESVWKGGNVHSVSVNRTPSRPAIAPVKNLLERVKEQRSRHPYYITAA